MVGGARMRSILFIAPVSIKIRAVVSASPRTVTRTWRASEASTTTSLYRTEKTHASSCPRPIETLVSSCLGEGPSRTLCFPSRASRPGSLTASCSRVLNLARQPRPTEYTGRTTTARERRVCCGCGG